MKIAAGAVRAFYLFDVADTINLAALRRLKAKASRRPTSPCGRITTAAICSFLHHRSSARLADGKLGELSYTLRAKFFDYGVISLRF